MNILMGLYTLGILAIGILIGYAVALSFVQGDKQTVKQDMVLLVPTDQKASLDVRPGHMEDDDVVPVSITDYQREQVKQIAQSVFYAMIDDFPLAHTVDVALLSDAEIELN